MKLVRCLLEIPTYQQVKFKICKQNAGSLNYTQADSDQEFLLGVEVRVGLGCISRNHGTYRHSEQRLHNTLSKK